MCSLCTLYCLFYKSGTLENRSISSGGRDDYHPENLSSLSGREDEREDSFDEDEEYNEDTRSHNSKDSSFSSSGNNNNNNNSFSVINNNNNTTDSGHEHSGDLDNSVEVESPTTEGPISTSYLLGRLVASTGDEGLALSSGRSRSHSAGHNHHSGGRKYPCAQCGRSLTDIASLQRHLR